MKCPVCSSKTKVIDTFDSKQNKQNTNRRRECLECFTRFTTSEMIIFSSLDDYAKEFMRKKQQAI